MLKRRGERISHYRTPFYIFIEFLKSDGEVQAERYSYLMVFIIRLEYFKVYIFLKSLFQLTLSKADLRSIKRIEAPFFWMG